MSEFPFPPERFFLQYADGPTAGPKPPRPITGDSHRIFTGTAVPAHHSDPATGGGRRSAAAGIRDEDLAKVLSEDSRAAIIQGSGEAPPLSKQLSALNVRMVTAFLTIVDETLKVTGSTRRPHSGVPRGVPRAVPTRESRATVPTAKAK